jgi:hypothetical protein
VTRHECLYLHSVRSSPGRKSMSCQTFPKRPTPKPKPTLALSCNSNPSKHEALWFLLVVDKEAPEDDLFVLSTLQAITVDVCTHFNGYF